MYLTCTCSHCHQCPFSLKTCISFLQFSVHYCTPRAYPNPLLMTYFPKYPLLSIGNKSLWMIFVIFRALGHAKFFMKFIKRHEILEECESAKTNLFITRLFISSHRVILETGSTYAWCMLSTHNHTTKHRQQSTGSSFAVLPLPGGARSSGRNTAGSAASRLPGSFPSSRRWWCPSLSCARSTPSRPAASPASPGSSSALPGGSAACRTPPASYLGAPRGASPGRTRSTRGGRGLQHPPRRALPGSCALPLPPPDSEAAQRARSRLPALPAASTPRAQRFKRHRVTAPAHAPARRAPARRRARARAGAPSRAGACVLAAAREGLWWNWPLGNGLPERLVGAEKPESEQDRVNGRGSASRSGLTGVLSLQAYQFCDPSFYLFLILALLLLMRCCRSKSEGLN